MISPFNVYGYDNRVLFESIPTQRNAGYSKPAETADKHKNIHSFFEEGFGVEPNIAHICSIDCPEKKGDEPCGSKDPCGE